MRNAWILIAIGSWLAVATASRLFFHEDSSVVIVEPDNFEKDVLGDPGVCIVLYDAEWDNWGKWMAPEYEKAATTLQGVAKVFAIDVYQHSLVDKRNVVNYPKIEVLGLDKTKAFDYVSMHRKEKDFVRVVVQQMVADGLPVPDHLKQYADVNNEGDL